MQENSDQNSGKFFSFGLLAAIQKEKLMSVGNRLLTRMELPSSSNKNLESRALARWHPALRARYSIQIALMAQGAACVIRNPPASRSPL
ncbi:MAG: hypothetical protein LUH07_00610 [Lachnospiraceae bacterium]|nr:hypothetical protein [Lachnospiraceae bacterium]